MWGEISLHIQEEIMKRLPVKSLVRFRSVCKAWMSLIDSSYFITAHTARQDQWQHLLVRYAEGEEDAYACIVDDDTFPQQRFVPTLPLSIKLLKRSNMVGSCNGLVCMEGYYCSEPGDFFPFPFQKAVVVLWNPSIRKYIAIDLPAPGKSYVKDQPVFGFGVCPITNDPKIVMIIQLDPLHEKVSNFNEPRKVMVYTLSSGKWIIPSSGYLPSEPVRFLNLHGQVIDRFMYWSGSKHMVLDSKICWDYNLIMSFDMTNDTFQVIDLPRSLACLPAQQVSVSKLRESLVILDTNVYQCNVWMMMNGVQKLFTKLFTIIAHIYGPVIPLAFRKSGTLIMKEIDLRYPKFKMAVYEPSSQHFNALEMGGITGIYTINAHVETLLLIGRSDCSSY